MSEKPIETAVNPYQTPETVVAPIATKPEYVDEAFRFRLFTAKGRLNRTRYFVYHMSTLLAALVLGAGLYVLLSAFRLEPIGVLVAGAVAIIYIVIRFMLGMRRCHDFGNSGGFMFTTMIPYVGSLFDIYIHLSKADSTPNVYGAPNPENSVVETVLLYVYLALIVGSFFAVLVFLR